MEEHYHVITCGSSVIAFAIAQYLRGCRFDANVRTFTVFRESDGMFVVGVRVANGARPSIATLWDAQGRAGAYSAGYRDAIAALADTLEVSGGRDLAWERRDDCAIAVYRATVIPDGGQLADLPG